MSAKSINQAKSLQKDQYIVEQAPSPAKNSRGRLFSMIFDEVFAKTENRVTPPRS
jgi:hypothetical protein